LPKNAPTGIFLVRFGLLVRYIGSPVFFPTMKQLLFSLALLGSVASAQEYLEIAAPTSQDDELLAVHQALTALEAHDARKADLVKLRYFAGLSFDEAAEILSIAVPTAKRDWTYARAWLFQKIKLMREEAS